MSKFGKIFNKVDMFDIFYRHYQTFYHYGKKKFYGQEVVPIEDKLLFLLLPFCISITLCVLGLRFNKDYLNVTLVCLSIFVGLLFGLLTMVFGLIQEHKQIKIEDIKTEEKPTVEATLDLTKELFVNIAFTIALSILTIIFVLLTQFYPIVLVNFIQKLECFNLVKNIYLNFTNGVSFFLITEFLLTLMLVLKKFTILFAKSNNNY